MPKKYRSKVMASIHEGVSDLYRAGGVDQRTMRDFDALCLTPVQEKAPQKIWARRTRREKPSPIPNRRPL
jgi:putative transcriptional regulator